MSESSDKDRVQTRSRAESLSGKEKFVLRQAIAKGRNPEKVLKELKDFKPEHHSSTVSSPASTQTTSSQSQEPDKSSSVVCLTSSEDEESTLDKTVVSAQAQTPQASASTSQPQSTKKPQSTEVYFKPRASLSRTPPKPREREGPLQEIP